ncbi:MAG TPA: bifunctional riboflavin kinase/FAD synthetase [Acidimicrobiales bacterium]
MRVITEDAACSAPDGGTVVTIGAYDGLHRGHRHVISHVQDLARERSHESAVITFDRHPASVVRPASAPKLLTDLAQKLELLDRLGVDNVLVVHFDAAQAAESAADFVKRTLVGCLAAKVVVVGEDFHFGRGREGDIGFLRREGEEHGFDVRPLALVGLAGRGDDLSADATHTVSSTAIRRALAAGGLAQANEMLGRPHEVRGQVMGGDRRGRELGFPTANVAVSDDVCIPSDGIYAGWYERPDGEVHPTAISLGRRPTFYQEANQSLLEAHLLDFSGDLYGEPARVRFVERLRGEVKFESGDALVSQIHADCDHARRALGIA